MLASDMKCLRGALVEKLCGSKKNSFRFARHSGSEQNLDFFSGAAPGLGIALARTSGVQSQREDSDNMPRGFGAFGRQEKRHEKPMGDDERENSAPEHGSGPMKKRPRKAPRINAKSATQHQKFEAAFAKTGD